MKVLRINCDGDESNHAFGCIQGDLTLCGLETQGDDDMNISPAETINNEITCEHCLKIIKHCRGIKPKETSR